MAMKVHYSYQQWCCPGYHIPVGFLWSLGLTLHHESKNVCKKALRAEYRLKATAAFYGEFKGLQATQAAQDVAAMQAAAGGLGGSAPRLTSDDIMCLIRNAVSSVLGASVTDDQPLVEAGLDSLGEAASHSSICFAI